MSRPTPRLNFFKSQCRDWDRDWIYISLNVETETETKSVWVSMSRPRPRLNLQSLNVETETETEFTTYIYLYLPIFTTYIYLYLPIFTTYILRFSLCWDRDSSRLLNSVVVETETHRDWEFLWLLRPRLIETGKFCGCRDRDSSRLGNSVVVKTETHRDWEFLWMSRPRPAETEQKLSRRRLHWESRWSLLWSVGRQNISENSFCFTISQFPQICLIRATIKARCKCM